MQVLEFKTVTFEAKINMFKYTAQSASNGNPSGSATTFFVPLPLSLRGKVKFLAPPPIIGGENPHQTHVIASTRRPNETLVGADFILNKPNNPAQRAMQDLPPPTVSSGTVSFFSPHHQPLARQEINENLIYSLPSRIVLANHGLSSRAWPDLLCVYRGLVIGAFQKLTGAISTHEQEVLNHANRKARPYFYGGNAFKYPDLYQEMAGFATYHAKALRYYFEGRKLDWDMVMAHIRHQYKSAFKIPVVQRFKQENNPEKPFYQDEETINKIIFGFIIKLVDDIGLSDLIDRRGFSGDYSEYLKSVESQIGLMSPNQYGSIIADVVKTAEHFLWRLVSQPSRHELSQTTRQDGRDACAGLSHYNLLNV